MHVYIKNNLSFDEHALVAVIFFTLASNVGVNPLGVRLREVKYGATFRDAEMMYKPENPDAIEVTETVISTLPNGTSKHDITPFTTEIAAVLPNCMLTVLITLSYAIEKQTDDSSNGTGKRYAYVSESNEGSNLAPVELEILREFNDGSGSFVKEIV